MAHYELNQPFNSEVVAKWPRPPVQQPNSGEALDGKNTVTLKSGGPFSLTNDAYGDHTFLSEISACQQLDFENTAISWQYRDKNSAQDILPFLYLGHMSAARDLTFVKSNEITMLVAVRDGKAATVNPKIMDPARFASAQGIQTSTFDVVDEFDFVRRFRSAIKQIVDHLHARSTYRPITQLSDIKGRVLVFCEAGDTRSACLVVLFLMVAFGSRALDAIHAVQARRFGVTVTGEMFKMLKVCEDVLKAERQVAIYTGLGAVNISNLPARSCAKRNADQVRVEDEEMQDIYQSDEVLRVGTAPFRDAAD